MFVWRALQDNRQLWQLAVGSVLVRNVFRQCVACLLLQAAACFFHNSPHNATAVVCAACSASCYVICQLLAAHFLCAYPVSLLITPHDMCRPFATLHMLLSAQLWELPQLWVLSHFECFHLPRQCPTLMCNSQRLHKVASNLALRLFQHSPVLIHSCCLASVLWFAARPASSVVCWHTVWVLHSCCTASRGLLWVFRTWAWVLTRVIHMYIGTDVDG